jgi:hypothetical protein
VRDCESNNLASIPIARPLKVRIFATQVDGRSRREGRHSLVGTHTRHVCRSGAGERAITDGRASDKIRTHLQKDHTECINVGFFRLSQLHWLPVEFTKEFWRQVQNCRHICGIFRLLKHFRETEVSDTGDAFVIDEDIVLLK